MTVLLGHTTDAYNTRSVELSLACMRNDDVADPVPPRNMEKAESDRSRHVRVDKMLQ